MIFYKFIKIFKKIIFYAVLKSTTEYWEYCRVLRRLITFFNSFKKIVGTIGNSTLDTDILDNSKNGTVKVPERCFLPKDPGFQPAAVAPQQRWYFDSERKECLQFTFVPSGGNANNFWTKDDCERTCKIGRIRFFCAWDFWGTEKQWQKYVHIARL